MTSLVIGPVNCYRSSDRRILGMRFNQLREGQYGPPEEGSLFGTTVGIHQGLDGR